MSSYKVEYSTLAITLEGIGNVNQGNGTAYLDGSISGIEDRLNKMLAENRLVSVINKIERVKGSIIK